VLRYFQQIQAMAQSNRSSINWLDIFWLVFLAGLAMVPPVHEVHKQLTLLAFAFVQLLEGSMIERWPRFGSSLSVLLKILLATILLNHTGEETAINSDYFPIYFVPVATAAAYFGTWATLAWTLLASAAYCSYLYPASLEFDLTRESIGMLALRVLFFFLLAMIVNRFAVENRRKTEELAKTNLQLAQVQEEARRSERLAALGQLSAGLAHEIRNPLGVIKGSAEMLNQKLKDSNPLASELGGYISNEVNRLSLLITRFLNFARPLKAETAPQNIPALLDHALESVSSQWQGGKIQVRKEYQTGLPQVPIDEGLFEQAFVNLIQNAYEAMGSTDGTLRIQAMRAEQNGVPGVEIRIKDTGPGIPLEQREQIFNPFVTTKATGVGLGLSIVSKIIDEHRGTIRAESKPGEGACFAVFFPAIAHPAKTESASVSS
jgi:two-component system, NtrC family, sensor histidine kinase HydH